MSEPPFETEPETIYTSTYRPDPGRALDVLAFLLVPAHSFVDSDDPEEIEETYDLLHTAKRHALITWFSLQEGKKRR